MKRLSKILFAVNIFTVLFVSVFFLGFGNSFFNKGTANKKNEMKIDRIRVNQINEKEDEAEKDSAKNSITKNNEKNIEEETRKDPKEFIPIWPMEAWVKKDATEFEIEVNNLDSALEELKNHSNNFKGLMVMKNGFLIYEGYRNENVKDELISIKSCTKSVMSILIGNAIKNEIIKGVDQNVQELFPMYFNENEDVLKKKIKLKHLLSMTSGIQWDQNGEVWRKWWGNKDRIGYTFNLPMSEKPGERFNYNSATSHLLSAVITDHSKVSTARYAEENLFGPLKIKDYRWAVDSRGYNHGNSELFLKMKDMGKIGYLYLRNGNWNGKQIVHEEWVRDSIEVHAPMVNYGYSWWVSKIGEDETFYASGYGGQYIYVYPEEDLVIVMASTITNLGDWPDYALRFIENNLIHELKESNN